MLYHYLYALYENDTCLYIGRSIRKPHEWHHSLKNKSATFRHITKYLILNNNKKYIVKILEKIKRNNKSLNTLHFLEYHEKLLPKFVNNALYCKKTNSLPISLKANYCDDVLLTEKI